MIFLIVIFITITAFGFRFAKPAGITVELRDISLAGRILAAFPEHLTQVACYCKRILWLQLYQ